MIFGETFNSLQFLNESHVKRKYSYMQSENLTSEIAKFLMLNFISFPQNFRKFNDYVCVSER